MAEEATAAVLVEEREDMLMVIINRPHARNAIDVAVSDGIVAALDRLEGDNRLHAAVLAGSGLTFCAGMDLKAFADQDPAIADRVLSRLVHRPPGKPLVAAIEGFALGGGLELALACDLIVASRTAMIGIPEVKLSLVPSGGALTRLPRRLPFSLAMEMALTGETFKASRLHELGLVNRLADPGQALVVASDLARRVAHNGPQAVIASKRILWEQLDWDTREAWAKQREIFAPVNASADAREGVRAFAEKRKPVWTGG